MSRFGADLATRDELIPLLSAIEATGAGLLLVSHRPEVLLRFVQIIFFLEDGRFYDQGSLEDSIDLDIFTCSSSCAHESLLWRSERRQAFFSVGRVSN